MKAMLRLSSRLIAMLAAIAASSVFALVGCAAVTDVDELRSTTKSGVKMMGVQITGVNHSHQALSWFGLSTGGGGGYMPEHWPSSGFSCALLPVVWTSDLKVRVVWRTDGGPVRSKVVPIERYGEIGAVYVHFEDNDVIRIVTGDVGSYVPEMKCPPYDKETQDQIDDLFR